MNSANKKPLGLALLGIIIIAIILYFVTDGAINLKTMSKTVSGPTDKEENMAYNDLYRGKSDNTLERDGVILRAEGQDLLFYALAGKAPTSDGGKAAEDVQYTLTSIAERSELDIEQISENVGYFYMYDGKDVWRIHTTNDQLKLTIENCLKFEPMGNYLYSIKERDGQLWLHRCMVTGADENYLFKESFVDFWAHSGDLLLERPDGSYMWYDVVTKNSFDRGLPSDAEDISLYEQIIYFIHSEDGKEKHLYKSHCLSNDVDEFIEETIDSYCIAEGYCAYFTPAEGGLSLKCIALEIVETTEYSGMSFPEGSGLDVSKNHLFVTLPDGSTWYSPLAEDNWNEIFNK